jgi:hypothetical protein
MQKDYYVYTHSLPGKGIFYVGKGQLDRTRRLGRKTNIHHTHILNKYGRENVIIHTMLCKSEERAFALEVKMIAALRNGGVKLANQTAGGDGVSGHRHTTEAKTKMSMAKKGKPLSPEHIARLKLRTTSAETRLKMSQALKNPSAETRAKLSAIHKGKKHSAEHISKIVKAHTGKKLTPEHKAKLAKAKRGTKHTDEAKAKMSAFQSTKTCSPETRAKISAANTGKKRSPEVCAKISAACKGVKRSLQTRRKTSIASTGR